MIVSAVCALALVTTTLAATNCPSIADDSSSWVVSLGGSGATATDSTTTSVGLDVSLGVTGDLLLPVEAGVRQSLGFVNVSGDSTVLATTRLYSDWTLFSVKKLDVFAGAAIGVTYGHDVDPAWELAPEAGARLWLKKDVALLARAEVPWNIQNWEYKDTVRYFLGFAVKF